MAFFIPVILGIFVFAQISGAQEKSPWAHESEASVVQVAGNTKSESYSAKQKTTYRFGLNLATASARYLQTSAKDTETAKQWDASLRLERELSERWALFIQHGAESDPYSGYTQRDNTDLGGKYYFLRSDFETLLSEAGFRKTMARIPAEFHGLGGLPGQL